MSEVRFVTTATEKREFRTCRRKWWLTTPEKLQRRNAIAWELEFGGTTDVVTPPAGDDRGAAGAARVTPVERDTRAARATSAAGARPGGDQGNGGEAKPAKADTRQGGGTPDAKGDTTQGQRQGQGEARGEDACMLHGILLQEPRGGFGSRTERIAA